MFEKRWAAVPPQLFTSNGTLGGVITVIDSSLFKVKQQVNITANTIPNLNLEIKSVPNDVTIIVGPIGANIFTYSDISVYTTALSSAISAIEQKRSSVPVEEINRAVYEEEPTVAIRNILVDKNGKKYDNNNPLPVSAELDTIQLLDRPYDSGTEANPTTVQQIFTTYVGGLTGTPVQRVTLNFVDATRENMINWQRENWNGSIWVVG
jgi:hypothetical protein